jgi:hypothetical protein
MRFLYQTMTKNVGILPKYGKDIDENNIKYNIFIFYMIIILIIILLYITFIFDEKEIKLIIS